MLTYSWLRFNNNAGDFFVSLSIAYVDDERRAVDDSAPLESIMDQEKITRILSFN